MLQYLETFIPHPYMKEMSQKSVIMSLPIELLDEEKREHCLQILDNFITSPC